VADFLDKLVVSDVTRDNYDKHVVTIRDFDFEGGRFIEAAFGRVGRRRGKFTG